MADGFNKEKFVGKVEGKLEDKYKIIKEIGTGGFSRCLLVKNKTTGIEYACKELPKKKLSDYEGLMREVNLMIKLDHPNIIKLYEVYENDKNIYLIMELCTGGELFDRIVENTENGVQFTEKQAANIFKQMMSAINYCHKNGIVHRDLKPENLLYLNKDKNSPVKVIDFGMSKRFDSKHFMSEKVGTAYYISPEVLNGKYDEKCDIWSAGVILYIIICGYPCFNGDDDDEIFAAIQKGKINFPSPEWDSISNDAKELIKKMCCSPNKRLTAEQVLNETWVKDNAPNAGKALLPMKIDGFKNYSNSNKLRKAQNNDFGWAHLPKSFMNQNTVFLLITAMAANFYRYIVALPLMAVLFGIKATDRVKSFLFRFIDVPAKWIKTARQYKLNIYSEKPYDLIWEHG